MTVHMISVGKSILDALGEPGQKLDTKPHLRSAIARAKPHEVLEQVGIKEHERDRASRWLAAAVDPKDSPEWQPEPTEKIRVMMAEAEPARWPSNMSAELETFERAPGATFPLRKSDVAILICSDTPRGLLAGLWNALALTDADLTRVSYLAAPGDRLGKLPGSAVLVRVPGMDAGDEKGFRDAMRGLGVLAQNLFASGQLKAPAPFYFHLSGGFKAAIPYLIGLAEAVRSIDGIRLRELGAGDLMPENGPYPVEAFISHETAGEHAKAIRLPLRRLVASAVRKELAGYNDAGVRPGTPSPALLGGYAYEVSGRPGRQVCELTPFGEGLRELFGLPPEPIGR